MKQGLLILIKRVITLLAILLSLIGNGAYCSVETLSNRSFYSVTTEDGLSHNEVRLITKCSRGFLWFGTQNGLSRYDGYRFLNYKHNINDSTSLVGDKVYSIAPSDSGEVWVGTTVGLSLYNPKTDSFSQPVNRSKNSEQFNLSGHLIERLVEDSNRKLFIYSSIPLIYDIERDSLYQLHISEDIYGSVYSICQTDNSTIFGITDSGKTLRLSSKYQLESIYNIPLETVYKDKIGTIWGCDGSYLYEYIPEDDKFERLNSIRFTPKITDVTISSDREGNLVIGGYGSGIYLLNRRAKSIEHITANPELKGAISSNDIYSIYIDSEDLVFIGTQAGLDICDNQRRVFRRWQHIPTDSTGIGNSFIQAIFRDSKDRLWFGTRDNGLDLVNNRSGVVEHLLRSKLYKNPPQGYISSIYEDSRHTLWVTTHGNGIYYLLSGDNLFYNIDSADIPSNRVYTVLEDRKGSLWFGTSSGVVLITNFYRSLKHRDVSKLDVTLYSHDKYNTESLSINSVYTILEDKSGALWFGANHGGLNLLHRDSSGEVWFESFLHNRSDSISLSSNEVFVLFQDSKDRIWVGTSSGGVNLLKRAGDKIYFEHFTEESGLADNEVNAFLEDSSGALWISTNRGISKLTYTTKAIDNFNSYSGVLEGKFRKNSAWRESDGTMLFGGTDGINIFNPEDVKEDNGGDVVISEVISEGERVLESSNIYSINSELGHVKIRLSTSHYSIPERSQYYYSVDGANWKSIKGENPEIELLGMGRGESNVKIRVGSSDNSLGEEEIKLQIDRGSFPSLYIWLSITLLLLMVYLLKVRVKRKEPISASCEYLNSPEAVTITNSEQKLIDTIETLLVKERLYCSNTLSLRELAERVQLQPNELSQLLNSKVGCNFYDFINRFRVDEVKRMLEDSSNLDAKLLIIAWDCGFNSKSVFYRVFKERTGQTPSQYQKRYCKRE